MRRLAEAERFGHLVRPTALRNALSFNRIRRTSPLRKELLAGSRGPIDIADDRITALTLDVTNASQITVIR